MRRRFKLAEWIGTKKAVLLDTYVLINVFAARQAPEPTPGQRAARAAFDLIPGPQRWVSDAVRFEFALTADLSRDQRERRRRWLESQLPAPTRVPIESEEFARLMAFAERQDLPSAHLIDGLIAEQSVSTGAPVLTNDGDFVHLFGQMDQLLLVVDLLPAEV